MFKWVVFLNTVEGQIAIVICLKFCLEQILALLFPPLHNLRLEEGCVLFLVLSAIKQEKKQKQMKQGTGLLLQYVRRLVLFCFCFFLVLLIIYFRIKNDLYRCFSSPVLKLEFSVGLCMRLSETYVNNCLEHFIHQSKIV